MLAAPASSEWRRRLQSRLAALALRTLPLKEVGAVRAVDMAASFAPLGHLAFKDPDTLVVIVAWVLGLLDKALVVAVYVTDL